MFMLFFHPFFSRFEMKHSKQLEESRAVSQAAVKELEQLQVAILLSCVQYLVISVHLALTLGKFLLKISQTRPVDIFFKYTLIITRLTCAVNSFLYMCENPP
jgi:hypothetical protein